MWHNGWHSANTAVPPFDPTNPQFRIHPPRRRHAPPVATPTGRTPARSATDFNFRYLLYFEIYSVYIHLFDISATIVAVKSLKRICMNTPMIDGVRRVPCYVRGHEWRIDEFRPTHGRVVCSRCGKAEWQRG
jgi:hypothetical protein